MKIRHARFSRMAATTRAAIVAYSRASSLLGEMPIEWTTLFLMVWRLLTILSKESSNIPAATNARATCLGDLLWDGDIGTPRPSATSFNSLSTRSQDSITAPRGYVSAISWIRSSIEGGFSKGKVRSAWDLVSSRRFLRFSSPPGNLIRSIRGISATRGFRNISASANTTSGHAKASTKGIKESKIVVNVVIKKANFARLEVEPVIWTESRLNKVDRGGIELDHSGAVSITVTREPVHGLQRGCLSFDVQSIW